MVDPQTELDAEQLALCEDAEFWVIIAIRRQLPTISREELERQLAEEP